MPKSVLFDTSVLIASMIESHPAHARSLPWLKKARDGSVELCVTAHILAELYAVMTRLPLSPRISPGTARHLIRANIEKLATIIDLDQNDYKSMLDTVSALQLSGGVVYDAISVEAARTFGADTILTLNESDFRRVWPDAGARITTP